MSQRKDAMPDRSASEKIAEQGLTLLTHFPRAIGLVWAAAPRWTIAWLVVLLIQGVLPVATVYLTRPVVDGLAGLIAGGVTPAEIERVLTLLALLAGAILLGGVLQTVLAWVRAVQGELVQHYVSGLVHAKSTEVDLAFYESAEYYDQMHRAREGAASRPLALLENIGGLVQSGVTLAGMAVLLLSFGWWVPLVLFVGAIPALVIVLRQSRRYHRWWAGTTPTRRKISYYDWMLTNSYPAAELRLFGLGAPFRAAFQRLGAGLLKERSALLKEQIGAQLASSLVALLIAGLAMAWMVWRAIQGAVTIGDLVLFYQAFDRGQGLMRGLLGNAGQIYSNGLFLSNLFAFLDLQPQVVNPQQPKMLPALLRQGVRFRDVTFHYPGSERAALLDFSLDLPAGKLTAIVGSNGAGKSTLVKLLCRFYDPQGGAIELDGVDIRDVALDELRRVVTVLFQFPISYQATAADNIGYSAYETAPDRAAIEAASRGAGSHEVIERLPHGYETHLGKWFADGVDLSGGEWQRVALARAFLRRSPIIVLDEPTSFMDSWAEAEWLRRFRSLVAGRTTLVITHRFTTAMRADVIHVMDAGQIVESGTHAELLAIGGRYAQSWRAQAREQSSGEAAAEMALKRSV